MADNYLEKKQQTYEQQKREWLRRNRHGSSADERDPWNDR